MSGQRHTRDTAMTCRAPGVFWRRVGTGGDEAVVVRENTADGSPGEDVAMFVVRGQLGVAWWSRMDGREGHDDESLVAEAGAAMGLSYDAARTLFGRFRDELVSRELVCVDAHAESMCASSADTPCDYPESAGDMDIPAAACEALEPESVASGDLVALGTFVGGTANTSDMWACSSQNGGIDNSQSSGDCRPGAGYGWFNFGYVGRPCPGA